MEQNNNHKILAFDTLYTTNHIQMLKILLPAVSSEWQHNLAVYIKFLELQYTWKSVSTASHMTYSFRGMFAEKIDLFMLCEELLPYCTSNEQSMLNNIKNMQATMQQFKEMEEMMCMMKDLFPEGTGMDSFSPDMMSDLFSMFQNKEE